MHVACEKGHLAVASVLVQNGADVNYENKVRLFYVHSQRGKNKECGFDHLDIPLLLYIQ